jgi:hypothetical protein
MHGVRFDGSHPGLESGGCCEGALFEATARNDQREYAERPLRETGQGSSRAVSGAPAPLKHRIRKVMGRRLCFKGATHGSDTLSAASETARNETMLPYLEAKRSGMPLNLRETT